MANGITPLHSELSEQLAVYNQGLKNLRYQAHTAPGQALHKTAQQFESMFVNEMLKTMRQSIPQGGLINSDATDTFTGMLDQQLAQSISTQRGIGLADLIVRQLNGTLNQRPVPRSADAPGIPLHTQIPLKNSAK